MPSLDRVLVVDGGGVLVLLVVVLAEAAGGAWWVRNHRWHKPFATLGVLLRGTVAKEAAQATQQVSNVLRWHLQVLSDVASRAPRSSVGDLPEHARGHALGAQYDADRVDLVSAPVRHHVLLGLRRQSHLHAALRVDVRALRRDLDDLVHLIGLARSCTRSASVHQEILALVAVHLQGRQF